jgi:hypothetical protein
MAMLKFPGDLDRPPFGLSPPPTRPAHEFSPVAAACVRYQRGAYWARRAGVRALDLEKLRYMRVMERRNCG